MILERVARWAHVRPDDTAVVWNDEPLRWPGFYAAILAWAA